MSWRFVREILAGVVVLSAVWCGAANAQSAGSQTYNKKPIAFFIAKGATDSCGKGCSEWIAAEGTFDEGAGARFQIFMAQIRRRDLPVFFNSRGGLTNEAIKIGYLLRRNRMTASIGITSLGFCKGRNIADDTCWRHITSSSQHDSAKLHYSNALCGSACVYAFVGASARRVPPNSVVAVHGPRLLNKSADMTEAREQLSAYLSDVGVDPALQIFSDRIPNSSMRRLSSEEIKRFNIEPKPYETPWKSATYFDRRFAISKALTEADQGVLRHTALRVRCNNGIILLQFIREAAAKGGGAANVKVVSGEYQVRFTLWRYQAGMEGSLAVSLASLERFAATGHFKLVESFVEPSESTIETNVSTAGFAAELAKLRQRCPGLPAS